MKEMTNRSEFEPASEPDNETSSTDTNNASSPSFADKIQRFTDGAASIVEDIALLIAYLAVTLCWIVVGFVAWLATLLCGVLILIIVMGFRLVAGLPVERETTKFLNIIQFWPDGFRSLARAFWSREQAEQATPKVEYASEQSYFFVTLRIVYVILALYILFCMFYNENPLEYFTKMPSNFVISIVLLVILTAGIAYLADVKERTASKPDPQNLPEAPIDKDTFSDRSY